MENYFEILKKCRMFTGLDIDDIKCLTEILNSKVVKYSKGDVIFSEGEKPEHIGVGIGCCRICEIRIDGHHA